MYHEFYGLNRIPFEGAPDPDFLFTGPTHREALAVLEYGVEAGMGFILLAGEVGLGKTTLVRTFLRRAERLDLCVIYVFHPLLSFEELLAVMAEELAIDCAGQPSYQLMRAIQRNLVERFEAGQRVVLIVDEAHRLPEATLENLRLISNLETDHAKLLQIVIVGQPELESLLATPRLRQLNQRITLRARLAPLSRAESEAYIRHRLQRAGAPAPDDVIAPSAVREISRRAGGVPRRINNHATLALIHGFGVGERPIRARRVRAAARPSDRAHPRFGGPRSGRWLATVGAGLAAAALGAVAVGALYDGLPTAWRSQRPDQAGVDRLPVQEAARGLSLPPPHEAAAAPMPDAVLTPVSVPEPVPPPAAAPTLEARTAPAPDEAAASAPPIANAPQAASARHSAPPPSPSVPASPSAPSPQLREAQQALRQLGYDPGPIDGVMGQLTEQALDAFQRDRKLVKTGTLTDETARGLALPN